MDIHELETWQFIALVIGGIWALVTFHKSNNIKAAEIFLRTPQDYKEYNKTLLSLESEYASKWELPLQKCLTGAALTQPESELINSLELTLRHFYVCAYLRRLNVDSGAIDVTYKYYLDIFVSSQRPDLASYLERYWRTILEWARTPRRNMFQRFVDSYRYYKVR